MGTALHLLFTITRKEEEYGKFCTWPPLEMEKILAVPPHCLTYHRNQRAETSWGSDVTLTFTKRVAKSLTALHERQEQKQAVSRWDFLTAFRVFLLGLNKGWFPTIRKAKVICSCVIFQTDSMGLYQHLPSSQSIYLFSLKSHWFDLNSFPAATPLIRTNPFLSRRTHLVSKQWNSSAFLLHGEINRLIIAKVWWVPKDSASHVAKIFPISQVTLLPRCLLKLRIRHGK